MPGIMFLGGFRSDMTGIKAQHLSEHARRDDRSYVRFDYQGHGADATRFEAGTIGLWCSDTLAVLDELTEGLQILVGSSMGGWLALLAALARPDRVAGLVLIAPAADFTEALLWPRLDESRRRTLVETGRLAIPSGYDPAGYVITRDLVEEGRRHLLLGGPIPIHCPVRLIHGMEDADVPWQHALRLTEALAGGDVALTLVKDGDHRLSRPQDLQLMFEALERMARSWGEITPTSRRSDAGSRRGP